MSLYRNKKIRMIILLSSVLFLCSIFFIFMLQQKKLNHEFNSLVAENLTSHVNSLKRQSNGIIGDLQNILSSISITIETSDLSPNGEWLEIYLKELSEYNNMYEIDYISTEQLQQHLNKSDTLETDNKVYEAIKNGESLVADIEFSHTLNDFYFTVVEPLHKEGEIAGALRVRMKAAVLLKAPQDPKLFQNVRTILFKSDGSIVYSNTGFKTYDSTGNLFSSMVQNGISEKEVENIKAQIADNQVYTDCFPGKGKEYFISMNQLDYNDWHTASFVRSPDLLIHSSHILKSVTGTGFLLILVTVLLCSMIGITILRQKQKLDLEEKRYSILSEFSDTILLEYDFKTDILEFTSNINKRVKLNKLKMENVSKSDYHLQAMHPDDRFVLNQMLNNIQALEEETLYAEARLKGINGEYCWFGCQYKYILSQSGAPSKMIGKLVDITDQRGREQSLIEQAQRDILTGVYNKVGEQMIDNLLLRNNKGLFFMIDLDNFKEINDVYGHAGGDELLSKVGLMLKSIFHENCIVARVGGDEFVAFIPGSHDMETAKSRAQSILTHLKGIEIGNIVLESFSASIGIALAPQNGENYLELYKASDRAMYRIKQKYKDGYGFYEVS